RRRDGPETGRGQTKGTCGGDSTRAGRRGAGGLLFSPPGAACPPCPCCPLRQPLVDLRPVHHVPPRIHVVRAAVLVLQVVGVLPDVDAEGDLLPFHQRAVLVRRALDRHLPALVDHP